MKKRSGYICLTFCVDLDPTPGTGHAVDQLDNSVMYWAEYAKELLEQSSTSYNGKVSIVYTEEEERR
jgi:hypothetical protein